MKQSRATKRVRSSNVFFSKPSCNFSGFITECSAGVSPVVSGCLFGNYTFFLSSMLSVLFCFFPQRGDVFVSSESEEKRFFITPNITKVGNLKINVN